MIQWKQYLKDLLGGDDAGWEQARHLVIFRDALADDRLGPVDRIRLIDEIENIAPVCQVHLMPWALELLRSPADQVRRRVLRWFEGVGEQLDADLLHVLVFDASALQSADGPTVSDAISGLFARLIVHAERWSNEGGHDLRNLLALRGPMATLSALLGATKVHRDALRFELTSLSGRAAVGALTALARGAPLMLRWCAVRLIAALDVPPDAHRDAVSFLLDRYALDAEPLIAVAALEGAASCVDPASKAEIDRVLAFIRCEAQQLTRRTAEHPVTSVESGDAIRRISAGVLRALAVLASRTIHQAEEPLAALVETLRVIPADPVINLWTPDLTLEEKTHLFQIIARAHGDDVWMRVQAWRLGRGVVGVATVNLPIAVTDPHGLVGAGRHYFWARACPGSSPDPALWLWQIVDVFHEKNSVPYTFDLRRAMGAGYTLTPPERPWPNRHAAQIEQRGEWMVYALHAIVETLTEGLARRPEHGGDSLDTLVKWFRGLCAVAISQRINAEREREMTLEGGPWGWAPGRRLRDSIIAHALNRLDTDEFFAALFPEGQLVERWDAQFVSEVALAALRTRPGVRSDWLRRHAEILRRIAFGAPLPGEAAPKEGSDRVRGIAAAVLALQEPEKVVGLTVSAAMAQSFPPAARFLTDDGLIQQREAIRGNTAPSRAVAIHVETLARALEADAPLGEHAIKAARAWLAWADARRAAGIPAMLRRRLWMAFARREGPLPPTVMRVRDLLMVDLSSEELQRGFEILRDQASPWIDLRTLRRLVRMLLAPPTRGQRAVDRQAALDRILRPSVVLSHIAEVVAADDAEDASLLRAYLDARREVVARVSTRAAIAEGRVLDTASRHDDALPLELRVDGDEDALRDASVEVAFVRHLRAEDEVRCVVRARADSLGAVDPAPGQVVMGSLRADFSDGMRAHWTATVEGKTFEVDRAELTADYRTLFRLDEAGSEAARATLSRELRPLRVIAKDKASVLRAPPARRWEDLVLDILARRAPLSLVFARRTERPARLIFEELDSDSGGLGALVEVPEGVLFDTVNKPLWSELGEGDRVTLSVERGVVADDGRLVPSDDAIGWFLVERAPRNSDNGVYRSLYVGAGVGLQVEIRADDTRRTATIIAPRPPDGMPSPSVTFHGVAAAGRHDAVVIGRWAPDARELRLEIKVATGLHLQRGTDPKYIASLLDLCAGHDLSGYLLVRRSGGIVQSYLSALPVKVDPLSWHLCPDLHGAAGVECPVFVRSVVERERRVLRRVPLPFLLGVGSEAAGVVIEVPYEGRRDRVHVKWRVRGPNGTFSFSEGELVVGGDVSLGDVLHADEGGDVRVCAREVVVALARKGFTVAQWRTTNQLQPQNLPAVLAQRGDAETRWLFVIPRGFVLEVAHESVIVEAAAGGAKPLDRVWVSLVDGGRRVKVSRSEPGVIRRAHEEGLTLRRASPQGDLLVIEGIEAPLIPIERRQLGAGWAWVIGSHDLIATAVDGGYEFALSLGLQYLPDGVTRADLDAREPLVEKVPTDADGRPRRDGDDWCVDPVGFTHPTPIKLREHEIGWLRPTADDVRVVGRRRRFHFFKHQGEVFASLRRLRPVDLDAWFERARQSPLTYHGVLRGEEVGLFGLDPEDPEDRELIEKTCVLLEAAPGEHLVVPLERVTYQGRPFSPGRLEPGDTVTRYAPRRVSEGAPVGIDLRDIELEISRAIERDAGDGHSFLATIERAGNGWAIRRLHGVGGFDERGAPREVSADRWRHRQPILEDVAQEDSAWLERVAKHTQVHVLFVRCEGDRVLFKVLAYGEEFEPGQLVYVEAQGEPEWHGVSRRLPVSLVEQGDRADESPARLKRKYFITDSLFSVRRGALSGPGRAREGVFMARVYARPAGESEGYELSLLHVPPRAETFFQRRDAWCVVAHGPPGQRPAVVEVSPGAHAELPFIRGLKPQELDAGAVLSFVRTGEGRYALTGFEPAPLREFESQAGRVVMLRRWGARDSLGEVCDAVGFPQVRARVTSDGDPASLTGVIAGKQATWGTLRGGSERGVIVGRLTLQDGLPWLIRSDGQRVRLRWSDVTVRARTPAGLERLLHEWRWRDVATDRSELSFHEAQVIARDTGRPSLTAWVTEPYPFDHLLVQWESRHDGAARPRSFAVALVEGDAWTLEVAPGRYVRVPFSRLTSTEDGPELNRDRHTESWRALAPGDTVKLVPARESSDERIRVPRLAVISVRFNASPRRWAPCVARRYRDEGGVADLSPQGEGGSMPCALVDEMFDFFGRHPREAIGRFWKEFGRWGDRLVARARVNEVFEVEDGLRADVDLVDSPGALRAYKVEVAPHLPRPKKLDWCLLRVVEAENGRILESVWLGRDGDVVEVTHNACRRFSGRVLTGDTVILRGWPARCEGLHRVAPRWTDLEDDVLRKDGEGASLEEKVLRGGGVLWVTAESAVCQDALQPSTWVLLISRRRQLDRARPRAGEVMRARVRGAFGDRHAHVSIAGVDLLMELDELVHGARVPPRGARGDGGDGGRARRGAPRVSRRERRALGARVVVRAGGAVRRDRRVGERRGAARARRPPLVLGAARAVAVV